MSANLLSFLCISIHGFVCLYCSDTGRPQNIVSMCVLFECILCVRALYPVVWDSFIPLASTPIRIHTICSSSEYRREATPLRRASVFICDSYNSFGSMHLSCMCPSVYENTCTRARIDSMRASLLQTRVVLFICFLFVCWKDGDDAEWAATAAAEEMYTLVGCIGWRT